MTCFGSRDTSAAHKVRKLAHAAALESGEAFNEWRRQVSGHLSDQGTERKVATAPLLVSEDVSLLDAIGKLERGEVSFDDPTVRDKLFLPNALEHIGHKHVMFNESIMACRTYFSYRNTQLMR